jgi:signal transduction histidine kinase
MSRTDASKQGLETLAAMGEIAARVAHELGNSLSGIQYSFLLIKDAIPADHPQFFAVAAIEREIARSAAVARQFYETYYPEMDEQAEASLTAIVGDAARYLEKSNQASRVHVLTDLSGAPSVVRESAALLRLVVYSLTQHAIDASPTDATVTIAARVVNDVLEIRASSNDVRADAKKFGLGLTLVRQTVAAAGGMIALNTTASGGVDCIATLPFAPRETRP